MINKIYLNSYGYIFHSSTTTCSSDPNPGDGIIVPEPVDLNTQYYDQLTKTIKPKTIPEYVIATAGDMTTISGLQNPSVVTIGIESYIITDGEIELEFDTPGRHVILIESLLYVKKEIVIET